MRPAAPGSEGAVGCVVQILCWVVDKAVPWDFGPGGQGGFSWTRRGGIGLRMGKRGSLFRGQAVEEGHYPFCPGKQKG